ncbi:MAG: hypothetical protein HN712_13785 [Gemmatimonadetes bacterium]|nr:hypothetical protein [Gemmatimonadota bacterium]
MLDVDHRALVSRADLIYHSPAATPLEGHPLGNGRMGTMVWTTPGTVCLQINRCDVYAVNKHHDGRQGGDTDYCGGCAQVSIELGGEPFQASEVFLQRLSLYDAECTIVGLDVRIRCFLSAAADILSLEVDDQRAHPQPVRVTVSMWRPPVLQTGAHQAMYQFRDASDHVLLVQQFDEHDHHCASGVAATILGPDVQVEEISERARTLVSPARQGETEILVTSSASWCRQVDAADAALHLLEQASGQACNIRRQEHSRWWSGFWSRTFVHLTSTDGNADFMERVRTLHLYAMAATSRGMLPPKWNGSLFITDGDIRRWGAQFWVWTTEMHYFPLLAAYAIDLTQPYFDMYLKQLPDCLRAGSQRWGAEGAFYAETTPFDGPVILPNDIGEEFQDVYLGRKSSLQFSNRARALGQYDCSLRVLAGAEKELAAGRYTWISHVVSSGCELAVQAWWRYRYTGDTQWLASHAYPLLKATVEFYRHLAVKEDDGRLHIHGTNVHEDFWGASDGIWDLAAIRGTTPLAIRVAQILRLDDELRVKWQDLLDHLAPYPMGSDPQSQALTGGVLANDVWAAGHLGDVDGQHNPEDVWLNPVFPFEDWTLETRDPAVDDIVQKTLDLAPRMQSILHGDSCNTAIRTPIAWVRAGRGELLPAVLGSYYAAFSPLPNGWSLFEGADQAHSIEHLGCISTALQEGLLQSVAASPGGPEIIRVFPAWPEAWESSFRLLARGGFLVTSAHQQGEVAFVEIESRLGEPCRLRNPWGGPCRISDAEGTAHELDADILCFDTIKDGRYQVLPTDRPTLETRRLSPQAAQEPTSYSVSTTTGMVFQGTLGRDR